MVERGERALTPPDARCRAASVVRSAPLPAGAPLRNFYWLLRAGEVMSHYDVV